jgi:hypothetical protein
MQLSLQREVVEAVGFILASIDFILKVDNLVLRPQRRQRMHMQSSPQRTQRRQRSRSFRLHRVIA